MFGYGSDGVPWLEGNSPIVQGTSGSGNWFESTLGTVVGTATELAKYKAQWEQARAGHATPYRSNDAGAAQPSNNQNQPTITTGADTPRMTLKKNWPMVLGGLVVLVAGGFAVKEVLD